MKALFLFIIIGLTLNAIAQESTEDTPDSLTVNELNHQNIDSIKLRSYKPLTTHFKNIITYNSSEGLKLAYYINDSNKWTSIELPFNLNLNSVNKVNLDKTGNPEIIIEGEVKSYGAHGGVGEYWMLIINTDEMPKQIFKVCNGGYDEMFGDSHGKGRYLHTYKRKITTSRNGIVILPNNKRKNFPREMTHIPSGVYVMTNGKINKKK